MTGFEYKVVPAPTRGLKAKGVKGTQARFANALQTVMNEMGSDGWEYQRTDTLPMEQRQGLTGKTTTFETMLVFRRPLPEPEETAEVAALIEDQSEDFEEAVSEDQAAPADEEAPELVAEEDQSDDTASSDKRISDTLAAPGVSVLRRRNDASSEPAKEDGPQVPAE